MLKKIIFISIFIFYVFSFCYGYENENELFEINDQNYFIDPMILLWNEILFLECSGFEWWLLGIQEKCSIINVVISSLKYFENYYNINLKIDFPEIKNYFNLSGKGLVVDIALTIDSFYAINRNNKKYEIETIKLIFSLWKQWENENLYKMEIENEN